MTLNEEQIDLRDGEVLVLRTCKPDGSSSYGFKYPLEIGAEAEAPDWNKASICGMGLHGLLWGTGDASLMAQTDCVWLLLAVDATTIVNLGQKVKFPRGRVVFVGSREKAVEHLVEHAPHDTHVCYAIVNAGDFATVKAGDYATVNAGDFANVKAGDYATVNAGYSAIVNAGDYAIVNAGDYATVNAGYSATVNAGDYATVKAGCGTVQISRWRDSGVWRITTRVITENEADTWWRVEQGVWRLCTASEVENAERKIAGPTP